MPKSNVPHPPSGAQKYSNVRFSRPETASPWSSNNADDMKAKTSDYKAWEQMRTRHGQGPIPSGRTAPPKPPRTTTFQPGNEPSGTKPTGTTPRRSEWDRWQESQAGMPGVPRSSTTRPSPKRAGFAPGTPGGDEPQAAASAYFKVSRGEHPTSSRNQTHMPPPPSPVPTAKKPDPSQPFRDQNGVNEPFGNKKSRASAQHQRGNGEGVSFKVPPNNLHRSATSATPRDNKSRTGFHDNRATNATASHMRAASAHSNHHSTSPPAQRDSKLPGMDSSSSSESSSEEEQIFPSAKTRQPELKKSQPKAASAGQRRPGFNLYARAGEAGDERMAPQANHQGGGYGIRRHSAIDLTTDKPSEGFQEHRHQHDAARLQPQSAGAASTAGSQDSQGSQPSLVRSHSWQDHRDKHVSSPKHNNARSPTGSETAKGTMYDTQGYNPFLYSLFSGPPISGTPSSDKWSDQWPFKSPRKPQSATAEPPPYWAIPSCLPPRKSSGITDRPVHIAPFYNLTQGLTANSDPFSSFSIPNYTQKTPRDVPPLRSQSSEQIDTKFSPEGYHPRFFDPPPSSRNSTPLRTVSPTTDNSSLPQQQGTRSTSVDGRESSSAKSNQAFPAPPPLGQDKYNPKRWVPHLNDIPFDFPQSPQTRSPSWANVRKRTWPRGQKPATAQPKFSDVEDEPTTSTATGESLESSKANSDVDAMDIDEPTPPSAHTALPQINKNHVSSPQVNGFANAPRRAPTLPPRFKEQGHREADVPQLNLGDLKDVYPLAPSNEGLGNLNDMATNLPFESRPSLNNPINGRIVQRFDLPQPPRCPRNPSSLTAISCELHGQKIRDYMDEWNKFNSNMTNILTARKSFLHDSSTCDWFNIQDSGYDDYMRGLVELRRARAHYDVACDHHEKSMQDLGLLRQEMKRGRGGVPE